MKNIDYSPVHGLNVSDGFRSTRHALIERVSDPVVLHGGTSDAILLLALECIAGIAFTIDIVRSVLPNDLPDNVQDELNVQFRYIDQLTGAARDIRAISSFAAVREDHSLLRQ